MINQIIAWSMFVVPWLTLFFMKRADIKRFMPAALFGTVLTTIIYDIGIRLNIWTLKENVFPFNEMMPLHYGLMIALTLWILKFTYGRFGLYFATNLITDIGFNFVFMGIFLPARGILTLNVPPYQTLIITIIHAALIYGYQIWQEDTRSAQPSFLPNLQPAANKPLSESQDQKQHKIDDELE